MKQQIFRKLMSRKLWMAIAGFVSGIIIFVSGDEGTASEVSGCIMSLASVIAYIIGEGLTDCFAAKNGEGEAQNADRLE